CTSCLVHTRGYGHTDQPIITLGLAFLGLLRFEDADKPNLNQASSERWLLHQNKNVQWIAVLGASRWDRTEVKGEHGPRRQKMGDCVNALESVVLELDRASLRRVDDYIHIARLRIPCRHAVR